MQCGIKVSRHYPIQIWRGGKIEAFSKADVVTGAIQVFAGIGTREYV
jgi:hypothetical protein